MEISKLPDVGLLSACRAGDARAWRQLVDRHESLVYSIALNLGLEAGAAEDVTVRVFKELEASLDALGSDVDVCRWLARTARRKALWHPSRSPGAVNDRTEEPVIAYERVEFVESLHRAFAKLDPRCSKLLMLIYFDREPRSYAELAGILDVPEARIGLMRSRCLKCLRRALDTDESGPLNIHDSAEGKSEDTQDKDPAFESSGSGGAIQWRVL
jgi:RNA polymerase sigma factor (sigma-70 family)